MRGYPRGFRTWLFAGAGVCLASGLALIPSLLEFRLELEVPWSVGSLRVAIAASHSLAASGLLLLVGALWTSHMRTGWREQRLRFSGALVLAILVVLILSATGLLYFGSQLGSVTSSVVHAVAGLAASLLLGWHAWHGAVLRRRRCLGHEAAPTPLRNTCPGSSPGSVAPHRY